MGAGVHLGFLKYMGPNFEMATNVQATNTVQIEKTPEHNHIYFLILSFPQMLNTSEFKPIHSCSESSLFIGNDYRK